MANVDRVATGDMLAARFDARTSQRSVGAERGHEKPCHRIVAAGLLNPLATWLVVWLVDLPQRPIPGSHAMSPSTERAILAGGCFWGVQDLLRRYPGVIKTRVGYSGGDVPNATYRNHGSHAEAVEIIFDPKLISYRKLLEFLFQIHDPTTLNRQGNDRGLSYRSAIFYTNDEQKRVAEDTIADVNASGLWPGKVVTEVKPAGDFWEAEPEHQDYLERYPEGYTCHFIRPDWVLPERAKARSA
jgi:peptide-methionine (S)-S-oxide reductase